MCLPLVSSGWQEAEKHTIKQQEMVDFYGVGSSTFPSSMGLSLMCTTGPGCDLVDLGRLDWQRREETIQKVHINSTTLSFLNHHVQCMSIFQGERQPVRLEDENVKRRRDDIWERESHMRVFGDCSVRRQCHRGNRARSMAEVRSGLEKALLPLLNVVWLQWLMISLLLMSWSSQWCSSEQKKARMDWRMN